MKSKEPQAQVELNKDSLPRLKKHISALSPINQKIVRRRNIVPAKIGYFAIAFMCGYGSILVGLYMIPIEVGKEQTKPNFLSNEGKQEIQVANRVPF